MSDNGKKWKPTKSMVRLLQAYVALEPNEVPTNTLLAMKTGINVGTLYKWYRKSKFQQWWTKQMSKHVTMRLDRVWTAMYQAAKKGEPAPARLFIERFDRDYKPTSKQEHEVKMPPVKKLRPGVPAQLPIEARISRFEELRAGGEN